METRGRQNRILVVATLTLTLLNIACFSREIHIYGGQFDLSIPGPDAPEAEYGKGWMADAVVNITEHIIISDIDVSLSIEHTSVFDLQIFLRGPHGPRRCLNFYNLEEFFPGADYVDTTFDDQAELSIVNAAPPFSGRFRPRQSLDAFYGTDAFGIWRLRIYDAYYGDTGTLKSFKLILATPEPPSVLLLVIGVLFAGRFAPRRANRKTV